MTTADTVQVGQRDRSLKQDLDGSVERQRVVVATGLQQQLLHTTLLAPLHHHEWLVSGSTVKPTADAEHTHQARMPHHRPRQRSQVLQDAVLVGGGTERATKNGIGRIA
jgi:hypothetical protein